MEDVQYVDNGTFVKAFSNDRFSTTVQFFLFLSGEWNGMELIIILLVLMYDMTALKEGAE
jgi:hypothetical protein